MATKNPATEEVTVLNPALVDFSQALANIDLAALVEQKVQEQLAKQNINTGNPIVLAEQREAQAVVPEKFLKHYRCDVQPDTKILRRRYDPETDTLTDVIRGEYMTFRRGHFHAKTQEEVDQLEWMIRNPQFDPTEPGKVLGGNPSIYEDDGGDIVYCPYCKGERQAFMANSNAYKAHLRATHGVAA